MENLEEGYYRINGKKRILYWDGNKWMKPAKDRMGTFGFFVQPLEKQPANVKSVISCSKIIGEFVDESDFEKGFIANERKELKDKFNEIDKQ